MPRSVRIGMVGTSWWTDLMFGPALQSHPQVEMAAICGRNRSLAEEMAAKYSIRGVYRDYGEMIAHGDLNAVIVATPDDLHYEITRQALGAGLHVLCEKPLALTAQQAWEMYEKAEAARIKHMVPFTSVRAARSSEEAFQTLAVPDSYWGDASRTDLLKVFTRQSVGSRLFVDAILEDRTVWRFARV